MKRRFFFKFSFLLIVFSLVLSSCSDDSDQLKTVDLAEEQLVSFSDAQLILDWYELYLDLEKDLEDFRPNPTARALAYIGISAYEAAIPGMPEYASLSDALPGFELEGRNPYNTFIWIDQIENQAFWGAVLNQVYYETFVYFLHDLTNDEERKINELYFDNVISFTRELSNESYAYAIERAEEVATSVIAYAQSDEEAEIQVLDVEPESYAAPIGIGLWKPTSPDFRNACHPYWYKVRRFVSPIDIEFIPPAVYSEDPSSRFYQEAKEVNDVVGNLSEEERWIAEFWSDDIVGVTFSPPARQVAIANQLVSQFNMNMEDALHLYMKLGIALNDAAVTCWEGKYRFNLERPIDYIRRVINPDFTTVLGDAEGIPSQNPNFPAYPSGHSTFAGVGAKVFEDFFEIVEFTDRCHEGRKEFNGTPRTFNDFYEMAEENAYSRIPLGVHFRMDCDEGLRLGLEVGDYVNTLVVRR